MPVHVHPPNRTDTLQQAAARHPTHPCRARPSARRVAVDHHREPRSRPADRCGFRPVAAIDADPDFPYPRAVGSVITNAYDTLCVVLQNTDSWRAWWRIDPENGASSGVGTPMMAHGAARFDIIFAAICAISVPYGAYSGAFGPFRDERTRERTRETTNEPAARVQDRGKSTNEPGNPRTNPSAQSVAANAAMPCDSRGSDSFLQPRCSGGRVLEPGRPDSVERTRPAVGGGAGPGHYSSDAASRASGWRGPWPGRRSPAARRGAPPARHTSAGRWESPRGRCPATRSARTRARWRNRRC